MTKTMNNTNPDDAKKNVPDIKVFGDPGAWVLICKASSEKEGWMKSTKAMLVPWTGCFVQVTTQQKNPDGSWSIGEAVTFVPGVKISNDEKGFRKLVGFDAPTVEHIALTREEELSELSSKFSSVLLEFEDFEKKKEALWDELCLDEDAKAGKYSKDYIAKKVKYIEMSEKWLDMCAMKSDLEKMYFNGLLGTQE